MLAESPRDASARLEQKLTAAQLSEWKACGSVIKRVK